MYCVQIRYAEKNVGKNMYDSAMNMPVDENQIYFVPYITC